MGCAGADPIPMTRQTRALQQADASHPLHTFSSQVVRTDSLASLGTAAHSEHSVDSDTIQLCADLDSGDALILCAEKL